MPALLVSVNLSAAVFSCLVCSVVDNTQIGTSNSPSVQIGEFQTAHVQWGCFSPCDFSLELASPVSWVDVGGCAGRGAFASRQGKL